MHVRLRVRSAASIVLLAACTNASRASHVDPPVGADARPAPSASVPARDPQARRDAAEATAQTVASAPSPPSQAYTQAMNRGREAASAKRWKEAQKAFEQAMDVVPHDPRAGAELGYVETHTNPKQAIADLQRAEQGSKTPKLTAQIEFNLGLAYEHTGDEGDAALAFWRSDRLVPSAAANGKLAGRTFQCEVVASRDRKEGHVYGGWLAALRGLLVLDRANPPPGGLYAPDPPDVKTEAAARSRMCVYSGGDQDHPCAGPGPFLVQVGANDGSSVAFHTILPIAGGKLLAFDAIGSQTAGGRCGDSDAMTITSKSADGRFVLASALRDPEDMVEVSAGVAGDLHYCRAFREEAGVDSMCKTACFPGAWTSTLHLYDVTARAEILTLKRTGVIPDFTESPKIDELVGRIDGDAVKVDGCAEPYSSLVPR